MKQPVIFGVFPILLMACGVSGCSPQTADPSGNPSTLRGARVGDAVVRVTSASYDSKNQIATINVTDRGLAATDATRAPTWGREPELPNEPPVTGEQALDITDWNGIVNYATTKFPGKDVQWARVVTLHPHDKMHKAPFMVRVPEDVHPKAPGTAISGYSGGMGLPPGVSLDPSIVPIAPLSAPHSAKLEAVLRVAESKLGTPYIWGHNEDRGQYGFDCSNFTSYVYHHALGYTMSSLSVVQYTTVGQPTPFQDMQTGDLLVFNAGEHVGIYVGNNRMIDAGGGKGQVSYMSIGPGSYWGNHISVVKRIF